MTAAARTPSAGPSAAAEASDAPSQPLPPSVKVSPSSPAPPPVPLDTPTVAASRPTDFDVTGDQATGPSLVTIKELATPSAKPTATTRVKETPATPQARSTELATVKVLTPLSAIAAPPVGVPAEPVVSVPAVKQPENPPSGHSDARREPPRSQDAQAKPSSPPSAIEEGATNARPTPALGLGGLTIRLDGPRTRVTDRPTATVSGRIVVGTAPRIVLQTNDRSYDVAADGRTFQAPVALRPGPNTVRVVASDADGHEAEDVVVIDYRPPPTSVAIVLTSPSDGHTLTADDLPIVVMEGQVDSPRVTRVRLVANDRRVTVPVIDGRFRHVIPVLEPQVRLRAEANEDLPGNPTSATVTVRGPGAPTAGVLVMNWSAGQASVRPEVIATFRARSDRTDVAEQPVRVEGMASQPEGPKDVFLLRKMQAGVYTFVLRYAAASGASATPLLYLGQAGAPSTHPLTPLTLTGDGRSVLTKVLRPHGVVWDQDDWFTGKSESSDTITKFRLPEGISWTERKTLGR
jgi:hypothetical protein